MITKKVNKLINSTFIIKIIKGFSWVAGGNVLSKLLISLGYIFLAKILTVKANGEFGILKSTVDNFLIFAVMGIGLTSTKYVAEYRNDEKEKAGSIFGTALLCIFILGLFIFSIILFFSDEVAINILKARHLKNLLIYVSLILILTSFSSVQQGALVGLQSFKYLSISYIAQGVLLFLGIVSGAYFYQVEGALIGYLISSLTLAIFLQYLLRKEFGKQGIRISLKDFKKNFKLIYLFAIPASLSTIISAPSNWILNTTLVRQENGYYEMGLYSATILFAMGVRMLISSLGSVMLPMFISNSNTNHKKEFLNYFSSFFMAIAISLPFLNFPEIIQLILGDKYPFDKVAPIAVLSFISSIIISHKQGIGRDLIIKNKMWLSAFSMFQWAAFTLIIHYFLKENGAIGLALSITIGYFLNILIFVPIFIKLKISAKYIFFDKYIILIFICLLIFVATIFLIDNLYIRVMISLINTAFLLLFIFKFTKKHGVI